MTICFFGYPNETYSRNQILIKGLRQNNVKVISCTDKSGSFLIRFIKLFKKFWPLRHKCDVILVQFPGQLNVPIAWALGKLFRKPIIFDAFVSLYDTYVFDREIAAPGSLKAKFYWLIDKLACTLADLVTLDTFVHIRYFVNTFKLSRRKFYRLPVGGDDTLFKPRPKTNSSPRDRQLADLRGQRPKTIIEFHGMFTKIHGTEAYITAAKKLEHYPNLEFWLIGDNPNYPYPLEVYRQLKPKTMKYWPELPVTQLARKVAQAHISIAHLGPTQKARMVLTNKMYHALASKVALIAGRNPASKEFLKHGQNCLMVNMYDANDLAQKILYLARHPRLRFRLAQKGYQLHQQHFTNKILGAKLKRLIPC